MIYPKKMTISGQDVHVEIIEHPLYRVFVCPHCIDASKGEPYSFHVPYGVEGKNCPACGRADTQPKDYSYIFGQYSPLRNEIKNWHNDHPNMKQVCETSFVHETIEAINSICDLQLPHQTIATLASQLYQAYSTGKVDFSRDGEVKYAIAA